MVKRFFLNLQNLVSAILLINIFFVGEVFACKRMYEGERECPREEKRQRKEFQQSHAYESNSSSHSAGVDEDFEMPLPHAHFESNSGFSVSEEDPLRVPTLSSEPEESDEDIEGYSTNKQKTFSILEKDKKQIVKFLEKPDWEVQEITHRMLVLKPPSSLSKTMAPAVIGAKDDGYTADESSEDSSEG